MSLATLKRKTNSNYNNHTNRNGFSLNGVNRYPSYIGKSSVVSKSSGKMGNVCCAYETNSPYGFNTVKNYNAINKHGRLTRWYKEDYTQQEWINAVNEAGLNINDYPYPKKGLIQKIKNNWVQSDIHGNGNSHIYTHNKKQTTLEKEFECNETNRIKNIVETKTQCSSGGILIENGIIKHQCIPITKDIGIGKSSSNALERIKHRRSILNPRGYEKPFPYTTSTPGFRGCKIIDNQAIDALKGGYFKGGNEKKCDI